MADGNPLDIISGILKNPDAVSKMAGLFQNNAPQDPIEETPKLSLPPLPFPRAKEDNTTHLLHALEPFLSAKRRGQIPKLEQAMQIGRMIGDMQRK